MGGSMQDAQRKAWNEAMRSAAGRRSSSHRRSDRQKKQARREKARKSSNLSVENSLEIREYRVAVRIDALEGIVEKQDDVEEEYDEEDDDEKTVGSKRRRSSKRNAGKNKTGVIPKRLKPRSLASILMEDAGRSDGGMTKLYLEAEGRPKATCPPPRKFCPVTGLFGIYTDPKSGIAFANLKALEQIREKAPFWISLGGSAAYSEAMKSLRNDD